VYILSLYLNFFGYSLGLLPSRALVVHPMIMGNVEEKSKAQIDYLSSTIIFNFIVDKKSIDYSHRELFIVV
jgi:hypothetical protein